MVPKCHLHSPHWSASVTRGLHVSHTDLRAPGRSRRGEVLRQLGNHQLAIQYPIMLSCSHLNALGTFLPKAALRFRLKSPFNYAVLTRSIGEFSVTFAGSERLSERRSNVNFANISLRKAIISRPIPLPARLRNVSPSGGPTAVLMSVSTTPTPVRQARETHLCHDLELILLT